MTGPAHPEHSQHRWRQIGDVANELGLSLKTIRHYDEVGLVPPSGRSPGGFRLYTDEDVDRLRLIKYMKPLGFTLEQMRVLLDAVAELSRGNAVDLNARAVIGEFAAEAEQRCDGLRLELERAEGFAAMLRHLAPRRPHP
ncbi:MAG: MerR family transcriptional regulator [Acidimicrobiia bacterium]